MEEQRQQRPISKAVGGAKGREMCRGGGGVNIPVLVWQIPGFILVYSGLFQILRDFISDIPGFFQRELYVPRYPFLQIKR